jgi:hypothetical protein
MTAPLTIEVEGRLEFAFDRKHWDAVKWDDDPAYHQGLRKHGGAAIDILATRFRSDLYLIEVKDPRGHAAVYRAANPAPDLASLIADKVRDTIAGVIYARDRGPHDHLQVHLAALLHDRAPGSARPLVILWLEDHGLEPAYATSLQSQIERRLRWLNPRVLVTSRRLWKGMAGMSVRSLAGAPWQG